MNEHATRLMDMARKALKPTTTSSPTWTPSSRPSNRCSRSDTHRIVLNELEGVLG